MSFVNISVATSLLHFTVQLLVFTFLLEDHSLALCDVSCIHFRYDHWLLKLLLVL